METKADRPGQIVFFGSGETSSSGQRVFDFLFNQLQSPVRVAILETPAGFELNSPQVARRVGDFLQHRLQNHGPEITIVPARKLGTAHSPDDPDIAGLIPQSDVIFMGPGSPTYTVRQLRHSLAWQTMLACHASGVPLVLASAAAIAAGAYCLPVYEIYKAGEELHWRAGLDLLAPYGLSLAIVPHWNNEDGGTELDTSHCYMGQARFEPLFDLLPLHVTGVGIDEHTALVIDLAEEKGHVLGKGGVTVLRGSRAQTFKSGSTLAISELGPFSMPNPNPGVPAEILARVREERAHATVVAEPPSQVLSWVREREKARARSDWAKADALRERIGQRGWNILDTRQGPQLEPFYSDRDAR
jgi:hypothetical protein